MGRIFSCPCKNWVGILYVHCQTSIWCIVNVIGLVNHLFLYLMHEFKPTIPITLLTIINNCLAMNIHCTEYLYSVCVSVKCLPQVYIENNPVGTLWLLCNKISCIYFDIFVSFSNLYILDLAFFTTTLFLGAIMVNSTGQYWNIAAGIFSTRYYDINFKKPLVLK